MPDTIFLRFTDRDAAITALQAAGIDLPTDDAGATIIPVDGWVGDVHFDIDVVFGTGAVFKPTGEVDADGNPVMAQRDGYHINMLWRGDALPASLQAAVITPEPNDPVVVFG